MIKRFRKPDALWRKLLRACPLWALDLPGLLRFQDQTGRIYYRSKAAIRAAEKTGRELADARARHRKKRKTENRLAREMLGGTGQRYSGVLHQLKGVSCTAPAGALPYDRVVISAMPIGWHSVGEIADRARWPTDRVRCTLETRLIPQGFAAKKREQDASGRPRSFYRLTKLGADLWEELTLGLVPERPKRPKPRPSPIGRLPIDQFTLCAMAPGEWMTAREICERAGVPAADVQHRQRRVSNEMVRRLLPGGMVERAENAERPNRRAYPFDRRPRSFFRLTEAGGKMREGLLLIG